MNTTTTNTPADPADWYAVPEDARVWYADGPVTPHEARAVPEGTENVWRDRAALPAVLPPGVRVAESTKGHVPPGSMRAYSADDPVRTWVRLAYVGDAGASAFVHARRVESARAAARAARQAAEAQARVMASCPCGASVPRVGSHMLAGSVPVCASCASAAVVIAGTIAARDELPDGRSRWEALEAAILRVWTPGTPVVRADGRTPDVFAGLPRDRPARDLPPVPNA